MNILQNNKSYHKSQFTMIELIAVISIMAILLTISIRAMKTDSTSANTAILGSTLKYAQIYAMSALQSDGTQTIKVEVKADEIVVLLMDTDETDNNELQLKLESLAAGSTISAETGDYIFDKNGKPDTSTATVFTIQDSRIETNKLTVTLRPFTGKVIYY